MAYLEMTRLSKTFAHADVPAVDGLSLQAERGDFVAIIGPSGCGKSTTLRLVAGLETPDAGTVRVDGRDVTALPPSERDVAMVFQDFALYPHLSVYENIAFPLKARRTPRREVAERVRETAGLLGIEELLGRKPSQLSGGQKQRVALGRALVRKPALFLMDEPLSNLDDHPVRHARPDGSPGAGHEGRRHGPRARAAGRHAGRPAPPSPECVRGRFHERPVVAPGSTANMRPMRQGPPTRKAPKPARRQPRRRTHGVSAAESRFSPYSAR